MSPDRPIENFERNTFTARFTVSYVHIERAGKAVKDLTVVGLRSHAPEYVLFWSKGPGSDERHVSVGHEFTNPPPEGKPKNSNRKTCAKCRSNVLNDHPDTAQLCQDVVRGVMDGYAFYHRTGPHTTPFAM